MPEPQFTRRILQDLRKAALHLGKALGFLAVGRIDKAKLEIERAIKVIDKAVLREMKTKRNGE